MTNGYEFYTSRDCHKCGMIEHESHMNLGADYVLASDYDAITAERDRLAAENAELVQACDDFRKELSVQYQLELEAKCHDDLEKSHANLLQVVDQRYADLATANATLDRLRAVGEDWIRGGESLEGSYEAMTRMYAILNPENET